MSNKKIKESFKRTSHFKIIFSICTVSLLIYQSTFSQIIDCSKTIQPGTYQVYLDELYYSADATTSNYDLQRLMNKLVFKLTSVMEGVMQDVGITVPCVVNYCHGRKPRNTADFNKALVDKLHAQDVVLEVWGSLEGEKDESDKLFFEAQIYYLLIPVWIKNSNQPIQPGIQLAEYKSDSQAGTNKPLDLLKDAPEMRIFVKIGIGINQLLNKKYDDARKLLCEAKLDLEKFVKSNSLNGPNQKEKALIQYVDLVAAQTVSQAKADPAYQGALRLVDNEGY